MTRIAILGATSQIAKDYILGAIGEGDTFLLYSRHPQEVQAWLTGAGVELSRAIPCAYDAFGTEEYDAVINFVGIGDPAKAKTMGADIFDVTRHYDKLASAYVQKHPQTRYVFLSSGAVYGTTFLEPATADTASQIGINTLSPQEYYSVAKLYAEARHRAMADLPIVDIRVFNYFSRTLELDARFFVTDILRAIRDGVEFETGSTTMQRDFLIPSDFCALVKAILQSPPTNTSVDAYSKAPVEKFELLEAMKAELCLRYRVTPSPPLLTATGAKPAYYSKNRKAETLGYYPQFTSVDGVIAEGRMLLDKISGSRN
jgi:nucleoside-diphosphate-sugar epimerase